MTYYVVLNNVGNPDFGQSPDRPLPGIPVGHAECETLAECRTAVRAYIENNLLGAGNWAGGDVFTSPDYTPDSYVGTFSYNGRLWNGPAADWRKPGHAEIPIDTDATPDREG